jgi:hypothetical protein
MDHLLVGMERGEHLE